MVRQSLFARYSYATELSGPVLLRPWQLAWRSDYGLAALCEPEEFLRLAELVVCEGFRPVFCLLLFTFPIEKKDRNGQNIATHWLRTNPDLGATEKITVTVPTKEWMVDAKLEDLPELIPGSHSLRKFFEQFDYL